MTLLKKQTIMKRTVFIYMFMSMACLYATAQHNRLLHYGDSCLINHDTYHALMYYQEALKHDSGINVRKKIAECHYKRSNYRKCADILKSISQQSEDSLRAEDLRELFYSYKYLNDIPEQVYWGEKLLKQNPYDGQVTADLAFVYNNNDNYSPQKAFIITKKYLQTDSTNIAVMRQYADSFFFLQEFANAAKIYEKLLASGDSTYYVLYSLGMCHTQTKDYVNARKFLSKAAEANKFTNAGCLYRLGIVCVDIDSVAEGIKYLNMAEEKLTPDGTVMFIIKRALGEGYYKNGEYWSAIYAWHDALKHNRNSMATIFNLAQAYGIVGKHDKEKKCYMSFLSMAALTKPNHELQKMIEQAERVAGKFTLGKGNILTPPEIDYK